MKFEYDGETDRGGCVAYIDGLGHLVIKDEDGDGFVIWGTDEPPSICGLFDPTEHGVRKLFYPGDKITITF